MSVGRDYLNFVSDEKVSKKSSKIDIVYRALFSGCLKGVYCDEEVYLLFSNCKNEDERCELIEGILDGGKTPLERFLLVWLYENMPVSYRLKEINAIKIYLNNTLSIDGILFDSNINVKDLYDEKILNDATRYHMGRWYRKLANLYEREKNFEQAIIFYDKSLEINPYYHGSYIDKAKCLNKMKQDGKGYLEEIINGNLYGNFPKGLFYENAKKFRDKIACQYLIMK